MPIFTAEEIDTQLAAYKTALIKLATAKEYTVAGRTFIREDLPEIRKTLTWLQSEKDKLAGSSAAAGRTFAAQGGGGRW